MKDRKIVEAITCRTEENDGRSMSGGGLVENMASLNGTLPLTAPRERWLTGLHGGISKGERREDDEDSVRSLAVATDPSHHSPPKSWATLQALGHDQKRPRGDTSPHTSFARSTAVEEVGGARMCSGNRNTQNSPPLEQQMLDDILLDWTTSPLSLSPLSISPLSPPPNDCEGEGGTDNSFLDALCAPLPLEWESLGMAGIWTRIWVLERPNLRARGVWRFEQDDSIDELDESPV